MDTIISRASARPELNADRPALRNAGRSTMEWVKLALLWLAVILPMLWGAMDALRDVRTLIP
jgi:hypothetical protein